MRHAELLVSEHIQYLCDACFASPEFNLSDLLSVTFPKCKINHNTGRKLDMLNGTNLEYFFFIF